MASVAQAKSTRSVFSGPNLKFFVAGGVIALAVVYLVMMGLQGTTVYFLTVSELQAKGPAGQNQLFRVSGNLVPGSLVHESWPSKRRNTCSSVLDGIRPCSS